MTNEERMRVVEINVETAKGRVPLIAGCHHQNPYEAVKLAQHAQSIGIDFVIILTPYMAARSDDAVFDYFKLVCERVDIGIVLFNTEQTYPISAKLAKRLATLPNICGFKQGVGKPAADHRAARRRRQGDGGERGGRGALRLQRRACAATAGCSTTARTSTRCPATRRSTTTTRPRSPAT